MEITLNELEIAIAKHLAKSRYEHARSNGIVDRKMGDQSNWETDLEGVASEIAFCKMSNLYPDLNIGLDRDYDCVYNGKKVDVKATKYKTGKLLATLKKKDSDIDIFVLLIGECPKYKFVGWATKEELISEENIGNLGKGRGYILEQRRLHTNDIE